MGSRGRAGRITGEPPYWLLTRGGDKKRGGRDGAGYRDVLTVGSDSEADSERILPLFGSEAAAASFLGGLPSRDRSAGWCATRAGAGELLMLLSAGQSSNAPCGDVCEVAFDPPAELLEEQELDVPTVGRRVFLDQLMGRGSRWSDSR